MTDPPPALVVRRARASDARDVAGIVAAALGSKYRPALGRAAERGIAALLEHDLREVPTSRHWVAEADGELAGAVHLVLGRDPDLGVARALAREVGWWRAARALVVLSLLAGERIQEDEAYIDELAVAGWARRRGIARELLARCERDARVAGKARLTLWVTIDNIPARALYEAVGFRERRRRRWIAGRLLFRSPGALFMERRLAPG